MSNIAALNIDNGQVFIRIDDVRDDVLTAAGADTFVKGTVLARNTTSKKLEVYDAAGNDDVDIPVTVLSEEIVTSGAGDTAIRRPTSGLVRSEKLVVHGVGTGVTDQVVLDALNSAGISAVFSRDVTQYDNSL